VTGDQQRFREAISLFATGVTVITTTTPEGPAGMTASAVCSLSLEPIQLLVCVSKHLPTHAALERAGRFAVNVLGEGQEQLALRFARPSPDKFAGVPLRPDCDPPVLRDAIAHFLCDVSERLPGGDHSIFIGRVRDCGHDRSRGPLLYYGSAFSSLEAPETALLRAWLDGTAAA
jgi:flavin reductase (DIM6/NTAB) family NADH-FMN oxidoreductase RutF